MMLLALSAASVGILHSISPGHWLPVVLMAKARKWPLKTALLGAFVTASGHILLSVFIALISVLIESHFLIEYEEVIEKYAGLALCGLGLIFAGMAFFTQWNCHGHTHSSSKIKPNKTPFLFLFTMGLSPCIAVLPVVVQATVHGVFATFVTLAAFSVGVLVTLLCSTLLVFVGALKLDHPVFEHYGDVVAGLAVSAMGLLLFFLSN